MCRLKSIYRIVLSTPIIGAEKAMDNKDKNKNIKAVKIGT
jgi:hypothetical protein